MKQSPSPMSADDPRHGRNAGYVAHCLAGEDACQPCRDGHATYKKNRRTRVYLAGGPLRVDATGTHRRLQALVALGYTMEGVDAAVGRARGWASQVLQSRSVFLATADVVAEVYDRWCMTVPEHPWAGRQRTIAHRNGWLPPLAWDDIDDVTEVPTMIRAVARSRSDVDPVAVERVMAGEAVPCTPAERREVVRRWVAAGRSLRALAEQTGWKVERYTLTPTPAAVAS